MLILIFFLISKGDKQNMKNKDDSKNKIGILLSSVGNFKK